MRKKLYRLYIMTAIILLILTSISLVSCVSTTFQTSSFYDAGASNFTVTGSQFDQYFLYRFDTSTSPRSFTLPSAADIIASMSSPVAGEILIFGVTADGTNTVTLTGGTNVTVKPSAATVQPNNTLTIYCVLNNVTSGSEAVTIY